jgi:hypothetical protein
MLHSMQHRCCIAGATCFHHVVVLELLIDVYLQHYVSCERCYSARMIQVCFTLCNMSYGTREGGHQLRDWRG